MNDLLNRLLKDAAVNIDEAQSAENVYETQAATNEAMKAHALLSIASSLLALAHMEKQKNED